mgnify:CR=1 FL=1
MPLIAGLCWGLVSILLHYLTEILRRCTLKPMLTPTELDPKSKAIWANQKAGYRKRKPPSRSPITLEQG